MLKLSVPKENSRGEKGVLRMSRDFPLFVPCLGLRFHAKGVTKSERMNGLPWFEDGLLFNQRRSIVMTCTYVI